MRKFELRMNETTMKKVFYHALFLCIYMIEY